MNTHDPAPAPLPSLPADRATLYVRVSKTADAKNLSKDGMLAECRALAEEHGLTVVGEHIDDGVSGGVRDRPALLAWLDDIVSGRAGVMVAWHSDRLTREGVNAAALVLDAIEGKDSKTGRVIRQPARLLTVDDRIDSDSGDAFRFQFVVGAEVARGERARIQARTKASRQRLRAAGRFGGGAVPYGMTSVPAPDGKGRVLALDEAEVAIFRDMAARIIAGDSPYKVARWLNDEGHKPHRAKRWSPEVVRRALRAAADVDDGRLPAATRNAVRRALDERKGATPGGGRKARSLLLAGGIVCPECGRDLQTIGRRERPYYKCRTAERGGVCSLGVSVDARIADAAIEADYLTRFGVFERVEPRVVVTSAADVDAAEAEHYDAQRALAEELTAEALDRARAAKAALDAARAAPVTKTTQYVPTGESIADYWQRATVDERHTLLLSALTGPIALTPAGPGSAKGDRRAAAARRLSYTWRADSDEQAYRDALADAARDAV